MVLKVNFKRVISNAPDATNAINMAVDDIPQFKYRYYPIVFNYATNSHFCPAFYCLDFYPSSSTARNSLTRILWLPSGIYEKDTIHTKQISGSCIKDYITIYGIIDSRTNN